MVGALPRVDKTVPTVMPPHGDGTPLRWWSIPLSEVIDRGTRLEAKALDVRVRRERERIIEGEYGSTPFGGDSGLIAHASYPGRFKRIYCAPGNGIPFYLPSQITDIHPKAEKFISESTRCDVDQLKVRPRTLLLSRSGTIGNVACASRATQGKVFSDDVIRIKLKDDRYLGFVYAFFRSKTGNDILATNGYGAVITHLEPEHLASIPIPDVPSALRNEVSGLIERSYELRDESNDLVDQASMLLSEALQVPAASEIGLPNRPVNAFNVRLSNMAGRLDASFHPPIIASIVEHLNAHSKNITTVGNEAISRNVILPGRFKRVYVDEAHGRVFIGGKQLGELDPAQKKYLSVTHHGERIDRQLELHEGMTLVTCSGTIGKVALVGKRWDGWTANQHIIRIVPANEEIAGYLSIFLSSKYGHELITRYRYGSVVDEINDEHVRSIPVPILKDSMVQKRINDLALEASEKRDEAFELERTALKAMDEKVLPSKR